MTADDGDAGNNIGSDAITVTVANVAAGGRALRRQLGQRGRDQDLHVHGHRPGPGSQSDGITESCGANGTRPTRRRRPLPVHVPGRAGELDVSVTADDGDACNIGSDAITVTVANLAPTVALSGDSTRSTRATPRPTRTRSPTRARIPARPITEACGANGTYVPTRRRRPLPVHVPGRAGELERVSAGRRRRRASSNIGSDAITVTVANVAPTVALSGDPTRSTRARRRPTRTRSPTPARIPARPSTESCGANGTYVPTRQRRPLPVHVPGRAGELERVKCTADRRRRRGQQHRLRLDHGHGRQPGRRRSRSPAPTRSTRARRRRTRTRSPTRARIPARPSPSRAAPTAPTSNTAAPDSFDCTFTDGPSLDRLR